MTVTTSKGDTATADLVIEMSDQSLMIMVTEEQQSPVSDIASCFEGLTWVMTDSGAKYEEYTKLKIVAQMDAHKTQVRLYKG